MSETGLNLNTATRAEEEEWTGIRWLGLLDADLHGGDVVEEGAGVLGEDGTGMVWSDWSEEVIWVSECEMLERVIRSRSSARVLE